MSKILINDKQYNHSWLSDMENDDAQNLLRRHHQSLYRPVCCCLFDLKNRELTIRKCTRFILARMPNTGENHAPWCDFFGNSDSLSTANGRTLPGIIERNGIFDVNLCSYLSLETKSGGTKAQIATQTSYPSRSTTTLLGLLLFLFHQAKINHWNPERLYDQSFSNVRKLISEVAKKSVTNEIQLSKVLFMPEWLDNNVTTSKKANQKNLFKKTKPGKASILIGKVNCLIGSKKEIGGIGVSLNLLDDLLWMNSELAVKATQSFGQLISEIKKTDRHILAICTVFRTGNYYTIGDIAFLRVSKQFIPVDSSHELRVENHLVAEKRGFIKPLRLDGALFLPDFILTDGKKNRVMEIYGIDNDPEYQAQKEKKILFYRENNIPYWEWTPKKNDSIPPFPDGDKN